LNRAPRAPAARSQSVVRTNAASLATVASVVVGLAAAPLAACFDLFHSTSDLLTACQVDASAPGCLSPEAGPLPPEAGPSDAGSDGPVDFCAWSHSEAKAHAAHACAWLGACEGPTGGNAFGPCMVQALLAYDCTANPNHRSRGRARALWDCLWRATTCGDVDRCLVPGGSPGCRGPGTGCGTGPTADVRFECISADAPTRRENCALWGQTCSIVGTDALCTGGATSCGQPGCIAGTKIQWCYDGGVDIGVDCANNGAGQCGLFGSDSDAASGWIACLPGSNAFTCPPSTTAQCMGSIAFSCPAGVQETVDCAALLDPSGACMPGYLLPPFDWTSPCAVNGGVCPADSCSGSTLTSCARGAPFTVVCANQVLGACQVDPATSRASCSPP
jgi:hypothetical protein